VVVGATPDALRVKVAGGGPAVRFLVRSEPRLSGEGAARIAADSSTGRAGAAILLLAANGITEDARHVLRSAGVSWVERDTGVCYLRARGLLVDRGRPSGEGGATRKSPKGLERRTQLRGRSGLVVESLLLAWATDRGSVALGDMAGASGVSRQLASRVLRRLTADDLLKTEGERPRRRWRVEDAAVILDRWADEERGAAEQSTGLYVWSPSIRALHAKLTELPRSGLRWALGGVSAANLYAPMLTGDPLPDVWIPADVPAESVARILGGEVVSSGANLRLRQSPGDPALHHVAPKVVVTSRDPAGDTALTLMLVSVPRAYVEARSAAGRGPEVAQHLRRVFLGGAGAEESGTAEDRRG
jgi:hypothetical protein